MLYKFYGKLLRDYTRAQPYADQLEAMFTNNLGQDYQIFIYTVLIPFYTESKQYKKAESMLARNEALCKKAAYAKDLSINHFWWFKLDSARANYVSAIGHYQKYKVLNDSLISESTRQRTSLLEVQYKTQEKEHKILELQQQSLLRESRLQQVESTRIFHNSWKLYACVTAWIKL